MGDKPVFSQTKSDDSTAKKQGHPPVFRPLTGDDARRDQAVIHAIAFPVKSAPSERSPTDSRWSAREEKRLR